jgi:predicted acylesterase/phospholipase RssA
VLPGINFHSLSALTPAGGTSFSVRSFQVVTGISAGAVLSTAFAVFDIGQEAAVIELMFTILNNLNQTSIFKNWPGGVIEGFFEHSSLFDSTPLRDLFMRELGNRTLGDRMVCMGAANLNTGGFDRFCKHETALDGINAALASSAIPGVFIDQQIGNRTYVDGGTLVNNDVRTSARRDVQCQCE